MYGTGRVGDQCSDADTCTLKNCPIDFEKIRGSRMGGSGSGRQVSCDSKPTTDAFWPLDIRHLVRKDLLYAGASFVWDWIFFDRVAGAIDVVVEEDCVYLSYVYGSSYMYGRFDCSLNKQSQQVFLESTPCYLGGERKWFLCPVPGCSRRALSEENCLRRAGWLHSVYP